jgi:hypothetical protein
MKHFAKSLARLVRAVPLLAVLAPAITPLAAGTGVFLIKSTVPGGPFALGAKTSGADAVILKKADRKDITQHWKIMQGTAGVAIENVGVGKLLIPGPPRGQVNRGTPVLVRDTADFEGDASDAKKATWEILGPWNGIVSIRQKFNSSHHLDAFGDGGWKEGTTVGIWTWNNNVNQKWRLEELSESEVMKDPSIPDLGSALKGFPGL